MKILVILCHIQAYLVTVTTVKMQLKSLKRFCSESSIHGFPYLSSDDIHLVEKIFWTIFAIISVICCLLLIGKILVIVREDPTVIYVSDVAVPVTQVSKYLKILDNSIQIRI
ncbi:hypothetical protein ACKWTF_015601 [Chironomus riparius]